ncbi:MAG: hypothetical protein AB7Q00_10070 [Phycisphaerales bacterium]
MTFPRSNPWLYFDEIKSLDPTRRDHIICAAALRCGLMRYVLPFFVWFAFKILIMVFYLPELGRCDGPAAFDYAPNVGEWNFSSAEWWLGAIKLVVSIVLVIGAPVLIALHARNKILHQAILTVLRTSTNCLGCKYPLAGIPINECGEVTCPECGMINIPPPRPRPPTPPSHCPACRYALDGLTPTVSDAILCPECGTVVPLEPESTLIAPSPKQPADNNPTHP